MAEGVIDLAALPVLQLALVAAIAFAGGLLGGVSAFGTGLLITPFIVPIFGIKAVVPVMSVAMVLGNLARAWANWRDLDLRLAAWIGLPAVPGLYFGTELYDRLPPQALSVVIGGFLLLSVPMRRRLAALRLRPTRMTIVPAAGVFGLVSGAVPGGGVLIMPILLGIGLSGGGIVGTDGLIGALVNVVKIAFFGRLDLIDLTHLVAGLLIGICTIPGAFAARWIVNRLEARLHTAIIEAFIILSGLALVWAGFAP